MKVHMWIRNGVLRNSVFALTDTIQMNKIHLKNEQNKTFSLYIFQNRYIIVTAEKNSTLK